MHDVTVTPSRVLHGFAPFYTVAAINVVVIGNGVLLGVAKEGDGECASESRTWLVTRCAVGCGPRGPP